MSPLSKEALEAFEHLESLIDSLQGEVTTLQGAIKRNEESLDKLTHAIQGEDPLGGGSLAVTLNTIRASADKAREDNAALELRVEELEKDGKEDQRERKRGNMQLVVSLVSAITAIGCAVIALWKR